MTGYGESIPAGAGRDLSVSAQADRLNAWVEHLQLGAVTLVGHDLGGGLVHIAAVRRPDSCAGLMITNGIGYDSWPIPSVKAMCATAPLLSRLPAVALEPAFGVLLARGPTTRARRRRRSACTTARTPSTAVAPRWPSRCAPWTCATPSPCRTGCPRCRGRLRAHPPTSAPRPTGRRSRTRPPRPAPTSACRRARRAALSQRRSRQRTGCSPGAPGLEVGRPEGEVDQQHQGHAGDQQLHRPRGQRRLILRHGQDIGHTTDGLSTRTGGPRASDRPKAARRLLLLDHRTMARGPPRPPPGRVAGPSRYCVRVTSHHATAVDISGMTDGGDVRCDQCGQRTALARARRAPDRLVLFCHHCRAVLIDRPVGPRRPTTPAPPRRSSTSQGRTSGRSGTF